VTDFHDVTEKIGGALEAHNEAVKRLTSGKGNALWIGQRIQELGVKTKRPLPNMVAGVSAVTKDIGDIDTSPTLAAPNQEKAPVT